MRAGEQISIKIQDIDFENNILHIRRAMTLDENNKKIEGNTKNKYSRRRIKLLPVMVEALEAQKEVYDRYKGEYFFCNTTGSQVHLSNLRRDVWIKTLQRAGLPYREIKQTRHTFATVALSCNESPLWIAKVKKILDNFC
ncbi:MAG: tyrosine-type recombinase/integrase [bacterium]